MSSSKKSGGGGGGGGGRINYTVLVLLAVITLQSAMFPLWTRQLSTAGTTTRTEDQSSPLLQQQWKIGTTRSSPYLNDESNVRIPSHPNGKPMTTEERLRYLELKLNSHLNFGTNDPFIGSKADKSLCKKSSELVELGCKPGIEGYGERINDECGGDFDHAVCLDPLPKPRPDPVAPLDKPNDCLVYDFGVRAQPQFGAVMARIFGCEVHAFDPSPVSRRWWKSEKSHTLRKLGNYHFHPYGAGGIDGQVTLHEYNWGQVSIIKYPSHILDCKGKKEDGDNCKIIDTQQKTFKVPVKTLQTIRRELGHENRSLDVMKLDVEGSEYAFLEQLLDTSGGCPAYIRQLALEWHHQNWDVRYGENSSPHINSITTLLHGCGLRLFWHYFSWPSNEFIYAKMGLNNIRFSLSSYINVNSVKNNKITSSTAR